LEYAKNSKDSTRIIVVSYSERGERIRIISSREAKKKEQREYENK